MGAGATVDVTAEAGVCIATLAGDVDLVAARKITPESLAALGTSGTVVLDLAAVTFLDSTGLRLIFGARRRLARRGRHLAVVVPRDEKVRQVFAMIDATDVLDLYETVEDAVAHCRDDEIH